LRTDDLTGSAGPSSSAVSALQLPLQQESSEAVTLAWEIVNVGFAGAQQESVALTGTAVLILPDWQP
jgi:hypothetical protein